MSTVFAANEWRRKPRWRRRKLMMMSTAVSEHLADLDADIEAHDVRHQPVVRNGELLQLGGEAEAVEQAEDRHATLVFGRNPNSRSKPPMFSNALYTTEMPMIASMM